jgi:hypothetical protein
MTSALTDNGYRNISDAVRTEYASFTGLPSYTPGALRSDIHEEASVKTGARRLRDFPDIHL